MESSEIFYILFLITTVTACSPFGRPYREQSRVTLALPANRRSGPVETVKHDFANQPPVLNFTSISTKGNNISVGMSVGRNSIHRENLIMMVLDEAVVLTSSTRSTTEWSGLTNVELAATAPKVLQQKDWVVNVRPALMRGGVSDSPKELRFTEQCFRELQERDYRRYDRYVEKVVPDSTNFYHIYVNYRSLERCLERLK